MRYCAIIVVLLLFCLPAVSFADDEGLLLIFDKNVKPQIQMCIARALKDSGRFEISALHDVSYREEKRIKDQIKKEKPDVIMAISSELSGKAMALRRIDEKKITLSVTNFLTIGSEDFSRPCDVVTLKIWELLESPPNTNAAVLASNSRKALAAGNTAEAVRLLADAVAKDPQSASLRREMARIYARALDYNTAATWYLAALDVDPHDYISLLELAGIYQALQMQDDAGKCYEQAIDYGPRAPSMLVRAGDYFASLEQARVAIDTYKEAEEMDPENFETLRKIYKTAYANEIYDEAFRAGLILLYKGVGDWNMLLGVLYAAVETGNYAKALPLVEDWSKRMPDTPVLFLRLAELHIGLGHDAEAITALQKYVKMVPYQASAYLEMAMAYYRLRKPAEALSVLSEAESIDPESPENARITAMVYEISGDMENALEAYGRFLSRMSDLTRSDVVKYLAMGKRLGKDAQCRQLLRNLWRTKKSQDALTIVTALGESYEKDNLIYEAISLYREAALALSRYSTPRMELARLLISVRQTEEASSVLRETIAHFSNDQLPLLKIGNMFFEAQDYLDARVCFQWAYYREPENPMVIALFLESLMFVGEYDSASYLLPEANRLLTKPELRESLILSELVLFKARNFKAEFEKLARYAADFIAASKGPSPLDMSDYPALLEARFTGNDLEQMKLVLELFDRKISKQDFLKAIGLN